MKACVVGSKGFIGSSLVRALRDGGAEVLELSSSQPGGIDASSGLLPPGFRFPSGTDVVFYLAQSDALRDVLPRVDHLLTVNAATAGRAAMLAADVGARKFIYASTGNVYAPSFRPLRETDPIRRDNWYALSKIHGEEAAALAAGRMSVTSARLFGVYGPGQSGRLVPNLAASILAGKPIRLEPNPEDPRDDGGLRLSLCHVHDVASMLIEIAAVDCPPCLNVAGPDVLSIREIAGTLGAILEREPRFERGAHARRWDLIADMTLHDRHISHRCIPFNRGIAETARMMRAGGR